MTRGSNFSLEGRRAGWPWGPHGRPRPCLALLGGPSPSTCSPSPEVQSYCDSKDGDCPLKPQMPDGPMVPGVFLSPPGSVPSLQTRGECHSPTPPPGTSHRKLVPDVLRREHQRPPHTWKDQSPRGRARGLAGAEAGRVVAPEPSSSLVWRFYGFPEKSDFCIS